MFFLTLLIVLLPIVQEQYPSSSQRWPWGHENVMYDLILYQQCSAQNRVRTLMMMWMFSFLAITKGALCKCLSICHGPRPTQPLQLDLGLFMHPPLQYKIRFLQWRYDTDRDCTPQVIQVGKGCPCIKPPASPGPSKGGWQLGGFHPLWHHTGNPHPGARR